MKNSRISHKKLLVARSNKEDKAIYKEVLFLPKE